MKTVRYRNKNGTFELLRPDVIEFLKLWKSETHAYVEDVIPRPKGHFTAIFKNP